MAAFGIGPVDSAEQLINFRLNASVIGGDEDELRGLLSEVTQSVLGAKRRRTFVTDFLARPAWPVAGNQAPTKGEKLQHSIRLLFAYAKQRPEIVEQLELRTLLMAALIASSAAGSGIIHFGSHGSLCSDEQLCEGIFMMTKFTNEVCIRILGLQYVR